MENSEQNKKEIDELMSAFRSLQQRLLQEVVNSHAETEMTLKQLVAYLNVSAQNLTEVRNIVSQFNTTIEVLKSQVSNQSEKIDDIEDKVNNMPTEIYKLKDAIQSNYNVQNQTISKYLVQLNDCLKKIYQMVGQQGSRTQNLENSLANVIKTIENDLDQNSENLTSIINTLIENKSEIDTKTLDVKASTNGQGTKKYEIKMQFWGKVIGIIFASGGFLYTIIDLIIKSIGGK